MSSRKFPEDFIISPSFKNGLKPRLGRDAWLHRYFTAALATKPGTFVDVGANRGQTLAMMLAIAPDNPYIGFEPQTDCAFFIDRLIRENALDGCRILPIGLSNRTGPVVLKSRNDDGGLTASAIEGFRPETYYDASTTIFVAAGDPTLAELETGAISLVKIDVEGGELEVIEGLQQTLARHRPAIFFEVLNNYLVVTDEEIPADIALFRDKRNQRLEALLHTLGYRIYNLASNGDMVEIERIVPRNTSDLDDVNYLAVHGGAVPDFEAKLAAIAPS